jgi:hypothetical protein
VLNVRRGLFRLWVLFAVLFIIVTGMLSYREVHQEFFWHDPPKEWRPLLPVDCAQARGAEGPDYSKSEDLCWYETAKFQALYPEYRDLDERELSKRVYEKAGRPLKEMRPWRLMSERAGIALGVPLAVLILGWALLWAFSGFRGAQANQ